MPQATRQALELLQETLIGEAAARGAAAVFVTGDDLRYVAVNEAACDVLGYTRDELLALPVSDVVISTAEKLRNASLDVMDGQTLYGTARVRRKDGDEFSVRYVSFRGSISALRQVVTVTWPLDDDVDSGDGHASAAAGRALVLIGRQKTSSTGNAASTSTHAWR